MICHKVHIGFGAIGSEPLHPAAGAVTEKACNSVGLQQIISVYHVVHAPGRCQTVFVVTGLGVMNPGMYICHRGRELLALECGLCTQRIIETSLRISVFEIFFNAGICGPGFIHVRNHKYIGEVPGTAGNIILGLSDTVHVQFLFRQIISSAGPGTEQTDLFDRQIFCHRFRETSETCQV